MIKKILLSITIFVSFSLIYIQKTDLIFELSILASAILIIRIFLNSDKAFCFLVFSSALASQMLQNTAELLSLSKDRQNQIIYNF